MTTPEQQLADALAKNALLANQSGLRDAADKASRATSGRVHYAYTTVPVGTAYYVFHPNADRLTYRQAIIWLAEVVANPSRHVALSDAELAVARREQHVGGF